MTNERLINELIDKLLVGVHGLYIDEVVQIGNLRLAFSHTMSDPWWNFAVTGPTTTLTDIEAAESEFNSRKRTMAVLCPLENELEAQLAANDFTQFSNDAWLTASAEKISELPIPPELEIVAVDPDDNEQVESFVEANAAAFDSGDPSDPYSEADHGGFKKALFKAVKLGRPDTKFFIANRNGTPVGASQIVITDDWCGLYGGAVLPEHRGQGIGKAMLGHRARYAIDLGVENLFLQTEKDARPYQLFNRVGFTEQFVAQLLVKNGD